MVFTALWKLKWTLYEPIHHTHDLALNFGHIAPLTIKTICTQLYIARRIKHQQGRSDLTQTNTKMKVELIIRSNSLFHPLWSNNNFTLKFSLVQDFILFYFVVR
jgi:hypothetical protein